MLENSLSVIHRGEIDKRMTGRTVRVLGIDLGTTNSTVSEVVWEIGGNSSPQARSLDIGQETLEEDYVHNLLPSIVAIHGGRVFIGEGAKRLRSRASELGLKQNQDLFYKCKNDIGNRRTYHLASKVFRSTAEISGKLLGFINQAANEEDDLKPDRVVVIVPASFQAAQRQDTLHAARLAGLVLAGGDLLDEPVAAFLDYLVAHGRDLSPLFDRKRTLVVLDFGGGTCDVAVFTMSHPVGFVSSSTRTRFAPISSRR